MSYSIPPVLAPSPASPFYNTSKEKDDDTGTTTNHANNNNNNNSGGMLFQLGEDSRAASRQGSSPAPHPERGASPHHRTTSSPAVFQPPSFNPYSGGGPPNAHPSGSKSVSLESKSRGASDDSGQGKRLSPLENSNHNDAAHPPHEVTNAFDDEDLEEEEEEEDDDSHTRNNRLRAVIQAQKDRIKSLVADNRSKADALAALQALCEELTTDYENNKDSDDLHQLAVAHLTDENESLRRQLQQSQNAQTLLEEKVAKFNEEWNQKTSHLRSSLDTIRADRDRLQTQRDELLEGHRVLRREVEEYQIQTKLIKEECERKAREERREADRRRDELFKEREEQLKLREAQLHGESYEVEKTLLRITNQTTVSKETIDQLLHRLAETEKVLHKKEALLRTVEAEVDRLRRQIEEERAQAQQRLNEKELFAIEKEKSHAVHVRGLEERLTHEEREREAAMARGRDLAQQLQRQQQQAVEDRTAQLAQSAATERTLRGQLRELQSSLDGALLERQQLQQAHVRLLQEQQEERQVLTLTQAKATSEGELLREKDKLIEKSAARVESLLQKLKEKDEQMDLIQGQLDSYLRHHPLLENNDGTKENQNNINTNNDHIETIIRSPYGAEEEYGSAHKYNNNHHSNRTPSKGNNNNNVNNTNLFSSAFSSPLMRRNTVGVSNNTNHNNSHQHTDNEDNVFFDEGRQHSTLPLSPLPPPPSYNNNNTNNNTDKDVIREVVREVLEQHQNNNNKSNMSHSSNTSSIEKEILRRRLIAAANRRQYDTNHRNRTNSQPHGAGLGRPPTSSVSSCTNTDVEEDQPGHHANLSQVSTVPSVSTARSSQRHPHNSQRLFQSNHSSWREEERTKARPPNRALSDRTTPSDISVDSVASHLSAAEEHVDAVQALLERYNKAKQLSEKKLSSRIDDMVEKQQALLHGTAGQSDATGVGGKTYPSAVENFEKRFTKT
ncbi:hypothetical protein ADEAN_000672500 [Angomonas deanei]|uniref:Uncharacterized protein n=1 Tax=Angomonas deanei TaxID=59799 RepID=A0A7G2CKX2_9TRYP|nr:hypothetical protein ADEAN_000672500 [Angomonas deanei]